MVVGQAEDVLRLVRRVFGVHVVGAYLHGSAVLDGMRPYSDVDVLIVLRRHTAEWERRGLVDELLGISGPVARDGERRPVELTGGYAGSCWTNWSMTPAMSS
jgi:streptomycin 3"-adenylyltransferase